MSLKYLVVPGTVTSQNDGQRHFVSFNRLVELYGVNPAECLNGGNKERLAGLDVSGLKWLTPRYDGNYILDKR